MTREELREKANDLPLAPGVYLMMDRTGKVIYVGKAKKLKNGLTKTLDTTCHELGHTSDNITEQIAQCCTDLGILEDCAKKKDTTSDQSSFAEETTEDLTNDRTGSRSSQMT